MDCVNTIVHGSGEAVLPGWAGSSIDLIFTCRPLCRPESQEAPDWKAYFGRSAPL